MNFFDKFCAVFAFILGAIFLLLGVMGLFVGCNAHFSLPPILDAAPALVGWGIVRPVMIAWKNSNGSMKRTNETFSRPINESRLSDE